MEIDLTKVTRLTVVNRAAPQYPKERLGRVFEKWDITVALSIQDEGRTLKVFVNEKHENSNQR